MEKNLPKISIITPSYNQAQFIEETILSVLDQNYPNLEFIVVDGGSTDGTLDILKRYNGRIQWFSERDRGQSHAINKGFAASTGQIVAYLNSDDIYEPGALLKVGRFFANHPEAAWVTGRCRIINPEGQEIRKAITWYKNFWLLLKSYNILLVLDYISQPATFWSREVLNRIGFLDETHHLVMDYDYSLRIGQCLKLHVINEYLASFRVHENSKSSLYTGPHFQADLEIARAYTRSRLLIWLHALHNALIVSTYRRLDTSKDNRSISLS